MKKIHFLLLICACPLLLEAQNIPVKTVTIFKNGKSMVERSGKVPVLNRVYSSRDLPGALFGTYWASCASGDLGSVFTAVDSVKLETPKTSAVDILEKNQNQPVRLWLNPGYSQAMETIEGKLVKRFGTIPGNASGERFLFQTIDGRFIYLNEYNIYRFEFRTEPTIGTAVRKKASSRLDLNFKTDKTEQDISLLYLTDSLGWTPVYQLDLLGDKKGKLSLRAEIANNAEDLGNAELRLAVGVPNFLFADQPALMVNFQDFLYRQQYRSDYNANALRQNYIRSQNVSYDADEFAVADAGDQNAQAEDFFFYILRPGNFPKNSRFQLPVLEETVATSHYWDCRLIKATPDLLRNYTSYASYQDNRKEGDTYEVFHYVEFKNNSSQPWTTGVVNLLSQRESGAQPVSQDMLPYTPPGAKCKVKIAQAPDVKVEHNEAVTERRDNTVEFFDQKFDVAKVEGRVSVTNYKNETVTLKIHRSIIGKPLSSDLDWNKQEENAYLWVNSSFEVEWELTLKPGESRNWKYSYEVLVDW